MDQVTIVSILFGLAMVAIGGYEKWRLDRIAREMRTRLRELEVRQGKS